MHTHALHILSGITLMIFMSFATACSRSQADKNGGGADYVPGSELPKPAGDAAAHEAAGEATAVLAGGCFWCVEAVFEQLKGVKDVTSGYAGGTQASADYSTVSSGGTDHAEAVRITYDPSQITYGDLLRVFFATHDPTTLNRQGPDSGRQYRSAIFYANDEQKRIAAAYIAQLNEAKAFSSPIVTTLEPLTGFYAAEAYHQDYVQQHPDQPYVRYNALPKVDKVRHKFPDQVKSE